MNYVSKTREVKVSLAQRAFDTPPAWQVYVTPSHRFAALRSHFANTSQTLREYFANTSQTLRKHFANTSRLRKHFANTSRLRIASQHFANTSRTLREHFANTSRRFALASHPSQLLCRKRRRDIYLPGWGVSGRFDKFQMCGCTADGAFQTLWTMPLHVTF